MARLSHHLKCAIIHGLAGFNTPGQVVRMVKADYGVDVTPQAVEAYDPTKAAGAKLGSGLRQLFFDARQRAISDLDAVPEAHKAVRVQMLGQAARRAMARGNDNAMAAFLKQIAEEVGGTFEGRRQVSAVVGVKAEVEAERKPSDVLSLVRETLEELAAAE